MTTPFGFFDLIETLPTPGCAICNLLLRDVDRLLDSILYEFVTEPKMQRTFRTSRGLCNEHGARLLGMNNALSVAVLYERVIEQVLAIIENPAAPDARSGISRMLSPTHNGAALAAALAPAKGCLACETMDENEARYATIFRDYSADPRLLETYRASNGLCLTHFQQVIARTNDREQARAIIEIQKDIWTRLRAELNEFMRKYDVTHADEPMGAEADSWRRAVMRMGGERGVFGLRR